MSSVNKKEIEKFSKMASEWWDPNGKFKPLHKFNPIRIKYIKENIISSFQLKKNTNKPLEKIDILDIGCGGGLLSEPMTRLGAKVTGIDASDKNIKIAKLHAKKNKLNINYLCSSPEKIKIKDKFDVILNMEIIEHVEDINFFIKSCSKLLKKDGIMILTCPNISWEINHFLSTVLGINHSEGPHKFLALKSIKLGQKSILKLKALIVFKALHLL